MITLVGAEERAVWVSTVRETASRLIARNSTGEQDGTAVERGLQTADAIVLALRRRDGSRQ
jgi:hypothetical protein